MLLTRRTLGIGGILAAYLLCGPAVEANLQYVCEYDVICWGWDGPYCYDETWYEDCYWQDDGGSPPDEYGGGPGNPDATIEINAASITDNQVSVTLEPSYFSGRLLVVAIREGGSTVLSDDTRGGGSHTVSFLDSSLPAGEYTQVEATWYPQGLEVHATHDVRFRVLGVYRHSQYNTPQEAQCSGAHVDRVVAEDTSSCTPITRDLRYDFSLQLDINGSGIAEYYGPLQVSWTCKPGSDYTKVGTITGSHGEVNNATVAMNGTHPNVTWGDQVKLVGAPTSYKTVTDTCPGCSQSQLDNYTTAAYCSAGAVGDYGNYQTIRLR